MAGAMKEITSISQKTANTFREAIQDILVPEIRSIKVSNEALRAEMQLRDGQQTKNLDALREELRLRTDALREELRGYAAEMRASTAEMRASTQSVRDETRDITQAIRDEMRTITQAIRDEMRASAQALHEELRLRDDKQALAMKNLSDKLDFAIDIRERLVQLEARLPRTQ